VMFVCQATLTQMYVNRQTTKQQSHRGDFFRGSQRLHLHQRSDCTSNVNGRRGIQCLGQAIGDAGSYFHLENLDSQSEVL
jgi:hypothetical protein